MEDGNIATTNKLKADTFAESLGKIHQTHYDPNHDFNTETEARNFLNTHKNPLKQNSGHSELGPQNSSKMEQKVPHSRFT